MSLIGPRPERPVFVNEFLETVPGYERRFAVRPGVSGLAQVRAGYDAPVEAKTRYDHQYVSALSLPLDLKIAIQTLAVIVDSGKSEGVSTAEDEDSGTVIDLRDTTQASAEPSARSKEKTGS